jgi:glycosyltransferase involved in cell wall biosynthesis
MKNKRKKVALVYDRVNKWGGAERVLLVLHEMFPRAPLYTSVYDKKGAGWARVFPKIYTSFLQKIPFAKSNHEVFAPLMPWAFESFNFYGYDLVISVTSEAAKGIRVGPGTLHLCYCLTPTRYLWSHHDEYFKGVSFKGVAGPMITYLRKWDKIASQRPDAVIAISTEVQKRIKKYYKRKSEIIFPPVTVTSLYNDVTVNTVSKKHYLVVSRLVKYKRIDLAVKVFNKLGLPLVVVGDGREKKNLKRLAKSNIEFVGRVSERRLRSYYVNAKALIMPQEEDFGIVSVEAQAYGVPVIAFGKGGVLDTVVPGKTGMFFEKQTQESLSKAIVDFDNSSYRSFKKPVIKRHAKKFSKNKFKNKLFETIEKMIH